jgi:putative MATE family efflux protein
MKRFDFGLLKLILALALPTMLEQAMQTAVQYIDVAMVGSLGAYATAATGATTTVNWLINSSISALSIGFLAYISRCLGAKDFSKAKKCSMQSVILTLICGIIFTALTLFLSPFVPVWMQVDDSIKNLASQYFFILYLPMLPKTATIIFGTVLRAAGDTKTPMKIGIIVNITNVILNFLLIYPTRTTNLFGLSIKIFGADMGVIGAATASAISILLGGILITLCLFGHSTVSPKGQSFRLDFNVLRPCLKIALPNMLQRFGTSFGYVAFASMINSLGEFSTAAHTVANTVESAFYIPGYGIQTAAATLAGNCLGSKDSKKMRDFSSMIIFIEVFLMVISGGLLFVFARDIVGLFSADIEVIALGSTVLKMVALSEPIYGVSIIIEGIMQGLGNTKIPFMFNIIGMWGIRIFGTFICINLLSLGLVSAWGCMILHNTLLFLMFLIYFVKGKWNPLRS